MKVHVLSAWLPLFLLSIWTVTAAPYPGVEWPKANPAELGLSLAQLVKARDYALSAGGSGIITRHGKVAISWGDQEELYDLKSSSKSIGITLLGVALKDGKVKLDDPAIQYQPTLGIPPETNRATGWLPRITLRQLANQTAGFEKPGGYGLLLFEPGTRWFYSDAGPNWLAECLTLAYARDLDELIFERVFTPMGIRRQDIRWRNHAYRPHELNGVKRREFGSGFHANVNAMARIGYLYLREGRWQDKQLIPAEFVHAVRKPAPQTAGLPELDETHGNASDHYSLLWWNNGDGTIPGLPRDAYWSWGLYDSLILVIPSLDIVAARTGKSWPRKSTEHYDVLKPFLGAIAQSTVAAPNSAAEPLPGAPYPPSPFIKQIRWASADSIIRLAKGSDNWPLTWGDDDALYGAYGDGNGFEPFVPAKLSMGFARITGTPPDIKGVNLKAANGEFRGDGRSGRKASGLLIIDGVLYLLARNLDNSQLAWSTDHGASWEWADWKFTTSFGCPSFVNFGPNYSGARDSYVYIVSPDSPGAYEPADRMVMARVPAAKLRQKSAYEFFVRTGPQPVWSSDIAKRGAIFSNPGSCYRGHITYNPARKRYLWCQVLPQSKHSQGPRFQGGFGIYDSPEPWGPWTTAFYTTDWDVGPGESSSLPPKWMSEDGKTMHLVFSGDDFFSVRRAEVVTE